MASHNKDGQYAFSRSYVGSARLTLQHWLWMHRIRYLLHPSIRLSCSASHPLKIADIGTGNAIWLIELAASPHLPPGALLDGFDISPDQYPAQKWLPENISLGHLDAMAEEDHVMPEELVGKYDVVHIRTFSFVVKRNDPLPLLRNLARMLKPNGHLQWDEMDPSTLATNPSSSSKATTTTASDLFLQKWKSYCAQSGIIWDWISHLPTLFREVGLTAVEKEVFKPADEQRKIFTDNVLMGLEDICRMFEARERGDGKERKGEEEGEWWGLFESMVGEMSAGGGGSLGVEMTVVVGRKG